MICKPRKLTGAYLAEQRVENADRLPVRHDEGDATERGHRAEGGDDRVDPTDRYDQSVDKACDGADHQTEQDAERGGASLLHAEGDADSGQADDGADGNVESARYDHDRLRGSENAEDGHPLTNIFDVARGEEHIRPQAAENREQAGECDKQTEIMRADASQQPPRPGLPPAACAGTAFCVLSSMAFMARLMGQSGLS